MSKTELDNLVRIKRLKIEPPTRSEYLGGCGRGQPVERCSE
ncbi:hypothetical protein ACVIN2_001985 [Bradyrhizobium sp. USDA 3650]